MFKRGSKHSYNLHVKKFSLFHLYKCHSIRLNPIKIEGFRMFILLRMYFQWVLIDSVKSIHYFFAYFVHFYKYMYTALMFLQLL